MKKEFRIIVFLVALCVLFTNVRTGFYYAFYSFDKQGFITLFCQNKNAPEKHCDGHCKLSEISKEAEKNNSQNTENQHYTITWIAQENTSYPAIWVTETYQKTTFYHQNSYFLQPNFYIFHPPIFSFFTFSA